MWEELWRRTARLTYENPVLWLPVLLADLLGFGLQYGERTFASAMIRNAFRSHSVLAGATGFDSSSARVTFFSILSFLLRFGVEFLTVILYAWALFITARLVARCIAAKDWSDVANVAGKVLGLGLRAFLVVIAMVLSVFCIIELPLMWSRWHGLMTWWFFNDVVALVLMCASACVLVPAALRALSDVPAPNRKHIHIARKSSIAAVVASTTLIVIAHFIEGQVRGSFTGVLATQVVNSVIFVLPYAPLYVALALLAADSETTEIDALAAGNMVSRPSV